MWKHEDLGVGVVEQVEQLVVGVAVVHVDRDAAHLERRVLRDHVLDAVVEVERDLRVGLQAEVDERLRETSRLLVVLAPRHPLVAVDQRRPIADLVGDRLPHVGEVDLHTDPPAPVRRNDSNVGQKKPCTGWGVYGDSSARDLVGVSSMSTDAIASSR